MMTCEHLLDCFRLLPSVVKTSEKIRSIALFAALTGYANIEGLWHTDCLICQVLGRMGRASHRSISPRIDPDRGNLDRLAALRTSQHTDRA